MKRLAASALVFLGATAAPGALAGPSGLRQFGDWVVGCDNTRHCRAVGLQDDGADEIPYFVLDRDAGPQANPRFHLGGDLSVDSGLAWQVDDKTPLTIPESAVTSPEAPKDGGDAPPAEVSDAAAVSALLAAMKDGQTVRFAAKPDGLGKAVPIPLKGLAASLLFIDDVQGRVDTVTALAKPGAKPASAVPAAPPLPMIAPDPIPEQTGIGDEVPKAVIEHHVKTLARNSDCEKLGPDDTNADQFRLSGNAVLYLVGCWHAAYQGGEAAYLAKVGAPASAAPLLFETIDEKTGKLEATMKSATDPDGLTAEAPLLSSLHKGRGVGGCGSQWSWAWSKGALHLASYETMPLCHSIEEGKDWITLWRSRDK